MDGRVKEIRAPEGKLVLSFIHPVTGNVGEMVFEVDSHTGLPEGVRFEDLKPEEPISVDYLEEAGTKRALLIKRVPTSGVPIEKNPFF